MNEKNSSYVPFVAWDGEGRTAADGSHLYTLLMNSTGSYIQDQAGLCTVQCVQFILQEHLRITQYLKLEEGTTGKVYHVWFAFGYDVNMILGDLSIPERKAVHSASNPKAGERPAHRHGECCWNAANTCIKYVPHKLFILRRKLQDLKTKEWINVNVKMYDTFSFFQGSSFLRACDDYLGSCGDMGCPGCEKDWPDRALVIAGKAQRGGSFADFDEATVRRYCSAEVQALVCLMRTLRERLEGTGVRPKDWFGPGAVARVLLEAHGVKSHIGTYTEEGHPGLRLALRHAYKGGRVELVQYGATSSTTWRYDIRSAYPHGLSGLPTYQGTWRHVVSPSSDLLSGCGKSATAPKLPIGMYRVSWACPPEMYRYPQPFCMRNRRSYVSYPPLLSRGWVWEMELEQAMRVPWGELTVHEAWLFEPADNRKPFGFVPELYEQRAKLKAAGDPAQLAVKLELNSLYGKVVQQVGWGTDNEGEPVPPPYFCLFWAGRTTAGTRAALYKLMIDNAGWDDLLAFETDACFTKQKWANVDLSPALGAWEEDELHDLAYVQSGVYACGEVPHVRGMAKIAWPTLEKEGFGPGEMVRRIIQDRFVPYEYSRTTFVGLAAGLVHPDKWRRWVPEVKELRAPEIMLSVTKRSHWAQNCECRGHYERQLGTWHRTYTYPPLYSGAPKPYDLQWERAEVFDESEVVYE